MTVVVARYVKSGTAKFVGAADEELEVPGSADDDDDEEVAAALEVDAACRLNLCRVVALCLVVVDVVGFASKQEHALETFAIGLEKSRSQYGARTNSFNLSDQEGEGGYVPLANVSWDGLRQCPQKVFAEGIC